MVCVSPVGPHRFLGSTSESSLHCQSPMSRASCWSFERQQFLEAEPLAFADVVHRLRGAPTGAISDSALKWLQISLVCVFPVCTHCVTTRAFSDGLVSVFPDSAAQNSVSLGASALHLLGRKPVLPQWVLVLGPCCLEQGCLSPVGGGGKAASSQGVSSMRSGWPIALWRGGATVNCGAHGAERTAPLRWETYERVVAPPVGLPLHRLFGP